MNNDKHLNLAYRPMPYTDKNQSYESNALYDRNKSDDSRDKDQINKRSKPNSLLTLQMECGCCCKKVSNIDLFLYEGIAGENFNYGQLAIPPEGECLLIETFCDGKLVNKQIASAFGIQISRGRTLPIVAKVTTNKSEKFTYRQKVRDESCLFNDKKTSTQCCCGKCKKIPGLLRLIMKHCNNQKITVEYTCGSYLKKAMNIKDFEYTTNPDYVNFFAANGECIVEKALCGDNTEDTGVYSSLRIPFENVCSIECGSVELC